MFVLRPFSLLISTLILILMLTGCGQSEEDGLKRVPAEDQQKRLTLMNQTAESMFRKVKLGNYMEARSDLLLLNDQMTRLSFEGLTSPEGMSALTNTMTDAVRVFNSVKLSPQDEQTTAIKVRLAVDALNHVHQPMWLGYQGVLTTDLNQLQQAAEQNKKSEALKAMDQLTLHYDIIRPSLLIAREASDVEMTDSLMVYLRGQLQAQNLQTQIIQEGIRNYKETLDYIFNKKASTAYLPITETSNDLYLTIFIGLFICSVLTYVGWRMFKVKDLLKPKVEEDSSRF